MLQREQLVRFVGDCRPPFVFRFFGQSRLFPAGSRCGCSSLRALNRSSFSWLLSVARFFAASSRIARKRRSLSCPVSLARLRAATFRLVPRRFSLCSVVSRARLEALLSRIIFKRFSRSSLDSWDSLRAFNHVGRHNPSELGAPRSATPYHVPTPSGR